MYHINSKTDKPDIEYLFNEVNKMMKRGIKTGNLRVIYSKWLAKQNEYKENIKNNYGIENPNSSAQVISYLDNLNDPNVVEACAPMGKWTSNKDALSAVANLGYQFGQDMLDYRTAKKYADSIKSMIDNSDSRGLIHPLVSATKTNRVSYKVPAIMNIPKELLWNCIIPMNDGDVLISADIKNQEPNILINMNNIESLKPALEADEGLYEFIFNRMPVQSTLYIAFDNQRNDGIMSNDELKKLGINPIFYTSKLAPFSNIFVNGKELRLIEPTTVLSKIGNIPELPKTVRVRVIDEDGDYEDCELPVTYNVDWKDKTIKKKLTDGGIVEVLGDISGIEIKCEGQVRKEFKTAWNAMTYGASRVGIKNYCKHIDGDKVYDLFNNIPELKEVKDRAAKAARAGQQKASTYFGTEVYANEYNSGVLKRVLMDIPIQGTASDILSLLVKHFNEEVEKRGYKDELFVYYTRHDELIIEAGKSLIDRLGIDKVKDEVRDIVEHRIDDWVPFKLEVKTVEANNDDLDEMLSKSDEAE